jgi:bifunctional UDP-N-acetylglucosamine pyrophosphorylase/glucosamine-1-phosphate N-acetyltransferase
LIGDVPRGVMLDQPPIFLGGQGGLVGPARIAYGTVIAAGTVCREDILAENTLYSPAPEDKVLVANFNPGLYLGIRRTVLNNLRYIGNLHALHTWYRTARRGYMDTDIFSSACHLGALARIESGLAERIRQLAAFSEKLHMSLEMAASMEDYPEACRFQQTSFLQQWPELNDALRNEAPENVGEDRRDIFLAEWEAMDRSLSYIEAVYGLSPAGREAGTEWLQAIVDYFSCLWNPDET